MKTMGYEPVGILYVVWSMGVGGAEKLAYDMVRSLPRHKFRAVVCSVEYGGVLGDRLRDEGYAVYHRKSVPGLDWGMISWLRNIIRTERVEVIHAHQYNPLFYSVFAAMGNPRLKLVYTEHGRTYPDRTYWKRFLVNPLLTYWIDHLVSISESTKNAMVTYDNFPARRIKVIHNGVDIGNIPEGVEIGAKRRELGIPEGWRVVGTAARLEEVKNLPMMLRAFRLILDRQPETCLVIAGIGSTEEQLRSLAVQLGVSEQVRFLGLRSDLNEIFPLLNVFLLTSFTEGVSITLLESMTHGIPAVVTNVGGNPEVVVDKVTGFLVPSGHHESMADKALFLMENPEMSLAMGNKAKERVTTCFSFDRMMAGYLALYDMKTVGAQVNIGQINEAG